MDTQNELAKIYDFNEHAKIYTLGGNMKKKVIGVVGPNNTPIGEDHHNSKLSDAQVEEIRTMHDNGWGYRRIAKKTGVPRSTVRDICTMRRRACTPDRYKTITIDDLKNTTALVPIHDDYSDLC